MDDWLPSHRLAWLLYREASKLLRSSAGVQSVASHTMAAMAAMAAMREGHLGMKVV